MAAASWPAAARGHDRELGALAARAECTVVAVDYRLAPLFPFPAAIEDMVAALAWAATPGQGR